MTEGSCAVPISRLDLHYDDPYVGIVECCPGNSSVMLNPYVYQCYNKKSYCVLCIYSVNIMMKKTENQLKCSFNVLSYGL